MGSNGEMTVITDKVLICATSYMYLKYPEISMLEEGCIWGTDGKEEYKVSFEKVLLHCV